MAEVLTEVEATVEVELDVVDLASEDALDEAEVLATFGGGALTGGLGAGSLGGAGLEAETAGGRCCVLTFGGLCSAIHSSNEVSL